MDQLTVSLTGDRIHLEDLDVTVGSDRFDFEVSGYIVPEAEVLEQLSGRSLIPEEITFELK